MNLFKNTLIIILSLLVCFLLYSRQSKKTCKQIFTAKDCYTKPRILFHASNNRNIKVLEPRNIKKRNKNEGPVIFATANLDLATIFLSQFGDRYAKSGSYDWKNFHYIHKDKEEFLKKDKGGAIYIVPSDSFHSIPEKGLGRHEWVSKKKVKPLYKIEFDSALEAMIDLGIQVFFVDEETFAKLKSSKGEEHMKIIRKLKSENQKRNKNVFPYY
ncbi:MAG: hypothetical protein GY830_01465 [Bacteroidetes bacterium]|nr:hypothetical protein [Bacteroidota bacterium]